MKEVEKRKVKDLPLGSGYPEEDTGPIIAAAEKSLELGDVEIVLPWISESGELMVRKSFEKARSVLKESESSDKIARDWFARICVKASVRGPEKKFDGIKPGGDQKESVKNINGSLKEENFEEVKDIFKNKIESLVQKNLKTLKENSKASTDSFEAKLWTNSYLELIELFRILESFSR